ARAARALDAEAFTVGADVGFREGRYDPASATSRHLLAHELTHVVQQGAAKPVEGTGAVPVMQRGAGVQRHPPDDMDEGTDGEQGTPPKVPDADKIPPVPPKIVAEMLVGFPAIGGRREP